MLAAEGLEHGGMVRLDGFHDVAIPAARRQDAGSQHADANEHDDTAQRIGERHTAEAADGGEQDDCRTEQNEAHHVRITVTASNSFAPPTNWATMVAAKNNATMTALMLARALEL